MNVMTKKKHNIKFSMILLVSILSFVLSACETQSLEELMSETESIDLSDETIDGIKLGVLKSPIIKKHNLNIDPDNDYYKDKRNYDQYGNGSIGINVDRESKEVLSIAIYEDNKESITARGIKVGDKIETVKEKYGEKYFLYTDREQGYSDFGYIDHDNNVCIVFTLIENQDTVSHINLRYTFNRMKWN